MLRTLLPLSAAAAAVAAGADTANTKPELLRLYGRVLQPQPL